MRSAGQREKKVSDMAGAAEVSTGTEAIDPFGADEPVNHDL